MKVGCIAHGPLAAGLTLHHNNWMHREDTAKVQTRNMTPEEIAERERPISRQERRQMERLRRKGRM